jgi:phage shock protein PspC (stress-responsive transcriptional regulator)
MSAPGPRRFYRTSRSDAKVAGVCGGLARYFDLDPTLVRVLWVILTIASFGAGFFGYLILWFVAPTEDEVGASGRAGGRPRTAK